MRNKPSPGPILTHIRDGMELKQTLVLDSPAPAIEATFQLDQGMELGLAAAGELVTVRSAVTREGQASTREFQAHQMRGVAEFNSSLFRNLPPGSLEFDRVASIVIHFRRDDHPTLLQQFSFQAKGPVVVIPGTAKMNVPAVVDRISPMLSWAQMQPDERYDILDRYIRINGNAGGLPDKVRVVAPRILETLVTWVNAGPIHSFDVASASVSRQVGYDGTPLKSPHLHPIPKTSPLRRAPRGGGKKKSTGNTGGPGTALN